MQAKPVSISDEVIAAALDNEWRTPEQVSRVVYYLLDGHKNLNAVDYGLERLARAGKIETKHEGAMCWTSGPPVCVNHYRKLQQPYRRFQR